MNDHFKARALRCCRPYLSTNLDTLPSTMASSPNSNGVDGPNSETDALSGALQATSLNDAPRPPQNDPENTQDDPNATRPLRIYTRAQLLNLHRSPLVQPPPDMPELKIWFG